MCFVQCFNGITITIINMGRKFSGVGGFPFNTKYPALRPTSIPSGILMHAAIWPQHTWVENWGLCPPLGEGEMGPHLTQCGRGQCLPTCQVSSWSVQPFGHSKPTPQTDREDRHTGRTDRPTNNGLIALGELFYKRFLKTKARFSCGNGVGLFWFRRFINLLLIYFTTYPLTYSPRTHTGPLI